MVSGAAPTTTQSPFNVITVTGNIKNSDFSYMSGVVIRFTLVHSGFYLRNVFAGSKDVTVNPDGSFFVGLWANADSEISTYYTCEIIIGKITLNRFNIRITSAQPTITLTDAISAGK